jgi:periplasmic protein TonB
MNEAKNIKGLFLPSGCLSESGLASFLHQELDEASLIQASQHLENCELCMFAVKGITEFSDKSELSELNQKLHKRIDLLLETEKSTKIFETRLKNDHVLRQMFLHMIRLRNIAAALPILILLGSVLWLTAALQTIDHRISGVHDIAGQRLPMNEVPEEIEEIIRHEQALVPPKPMVAEFKITEEEPFVEDDFIIEPDHEIIIDHNYTVPELVEDEVQEMEIFIVVEEPPRFPGGHEAINKFLVENIHYPQLARQQGIQGTVYITFVIDTVGSVKDARILRGVHFSLDEEAIRVINAMPKWIPGKQRGKPVKVQFTMPVRFALE